MRFVYNAFAGRYTDSPRAIFEDLVRRGGDHEHVWLADPVHLAGFPDGVRTVDIGSAEAVAALESADFHIANSHTNVDWNKPADCIYLQTWHGTPLKRIHYDSLLVTEGLLDRLDLDVARWDILLSPNAASTPLLRQAFRFEGPMPETGYPRNDILLSPDRDAVRARVRKELGIPDGTRAVLYAPTWRDDFLFSNPEGPVELDLDVQRFADELGGDHMLLLRLHYMLTGRLQGTEHDAVRDVSFHPDISELYLAADVLVTDYSSVMFDWAVTGKPELLYTYDLDAYRDSIRGFYWDIEPVAPGPLLRTTDELIAALRDLPAVVKASAERYAAFRERFCHLEDGHATDRAIELLLSTAERRP